MRALYQVINNYVEMQIPPKDIVALVQDEYRIEIRFYDVPKEDLPSVYLTLAEYGWFQRYGYIPIDNKKQE